jgi:signal transduction histidine kinase
MMTRTEELRAVLEVAHQEQLRDRTARADEIEQQVMQPLTAAWLEIDALRQELRGAGQNIHYGYLDMAAALIQESVGSLLRIASRCWPRALDAGLANAIQWKLNDREEVQGLRGKLEAVGDGPATHDDMEALLYNVAEELLSIVGNPSHTATVKLDSNEHMQMLRLSSGGNGHADGAVALALARVREQLRPYGGTIAAFPEANGFVTYSVMVPINNASTFAP